MKQRTARIDRTTTETDIHVRLNLDGRGRYTVSTGIRFLDHMLELFTRHGGFDLHLRARGDLDVDQHHTVEDTGIALGEAVREALGSKKGINRAGYFVMTMDEALALAAIDLSGRAYLMINAPALAKAARRGLRVGDLDIDLIEDFFQGFASSAGANIHLKVFYGRSNHHQVEALFKSFARALRYACSKDARLKRLLPSTKGLL
ncbi:MAG TPA: imidazoleglycerol-phosphate dehydratase HisB [Terriglobia bacterium]|nr:imidazoleglycerol-phosphate dehydratase HisB [Terriglobia bacterium]